MPQTELQSTGRSRCLLDWQVVAFPLAKSKRKLMGHIKWLLDHRHPGRMGRPALAELESTAHYRLSRNYTIANLQTALAVYDLWRAGKVNQNGKKMTL